MTAVQASTQNIPSRDCGGEEAAESHMPHPQCLEWYHEFGLRCGNTFKQNRHIASQAGCKTSQAFNFLVDEQWRKGDCAAHGQAWVKTTRRTFQVAILEEWEQQRVESLAPTPHGEEFLECNHNAGTDDDDDVV